MIMQSSSCWSMDTFSLLPNSSSSSPSPSVYAQCSQPSSLPLMPSLHDAQDHLPESWSQLMLGGGCMGEDEKYGYPSSPAVHQHVDDMKQEYLQGSDKLGPWSQILQSVISSPRACITTSLSTNMLEFTSSKSDQRSLHHQPDNSSECNSKKARVQGSSANSTFKAQARKEKLGDRITALHQIVSPFGKTDTASVLLEAIGYIRFLQSQIQVLSSPHLSAAASGNTSVKQAAHISNEGGTKKRAGPDQEWMSINEAKKNTARRDLKSRGLCLVPVSYFVDLGGGGGGGACWTPSLHAAFQLSMAS